MPYPVLQMYILYLVTDYSSGNRKASDIWVLSYLHNANLLTVLGLKPKFKIAGFSESFRLAVKVQHET